MNWRESVTIGVSIVIHAPATPAVAIGSTVATITALGDAGDRTTIPSDGVPVVALFVGVYDTISAASRSANASSAQVSTAAHQGAIDVSLARDALPLGVAA